MKIDELRRRIFETIKIVNTAIEEYRSTSDSEHQKSAASLIINNVHSLARYVKIFPTCKSEAEKSNLLFFNVKFGELHLKDKCVVSISLENILTGIQASNQAFTKTQLANQCVDLVFKLDDDAELKCDADSLTTAIRELAS